MKPTRQLPGFDMAVRAERRIRVVPFTVSKAKARALLEACRAHGVTMQGALGAAQLLAVNDEFAAARSRNLALNSLADLRGLLGGNLTQQDLGLYIATVTTVHAIPAEPDFWALAADVRNQLKAVLDSGDANLVHTIHREGALYPPNEVGARMVQGLVGLAPPSSMLTNVGRFDPVALAHGAKLRSAGRSWCRRPPSTRSASRCRAWAKACTSICCTTSARSTPYRPGVWPMRWPHRLVLAASA